MYLITFIFGCAGSSLMLVVSSLVVASRGCSLVVVHNLLTVVASLVADTGSRACGLSSCGM